MSCVLFVGSAAAILLALGPGVDFEYRVHNSVKVVASNSACLVVRDPVVDGTWANVAVFGLARIGSIVYSEV